MTGRILQCFSSILLCNLVSDFVVKLRQRLFSQSTKNYEAEKANRKTKVCLPNQQSIGLFGASFFFVSISFVFRTTGKTLQVKSE